MTAPEPGRRRVVASVPDLFFSAKIAAVAKAAGVDLALVPPARLLDACATPPLPALVLLDLHAPGEPLGMVRALKADPASRAIPIVGFYSHVEDDRRREALAAGIDRALPRSAFVAQLPALLAGPPAPNPGRPA